MVGDGVKRLGPKVAGGGPQEGDIFKPSVQAPLSGTDKPTIEESSYQDVQGNNITGAGLPGTEAGSIDTEKMLAVDELLSFARENPEYLYEMYSKLEALSALYHGMSPEGEEESALIDGACERVDEMLIGLHTAFIELREVNKEQRKGFYQGDGSLVGFRANAYLQSRSVDLIIGRVTGPNYRSINEVLGEVDFLRKSGRYKKETAYRLYNETLRVVGENLYLSRLSEVRVLKERLLEDPEGVVKEMRSDADAYLQLTEEYNIWEGLPKSDPRYYLTRMNRMAELSEALGSLALVHRLEKADIIAIAAGVRSSSEIREVIKRQLDEMEPRLQQETLCALSGEANFAEDRVALAMTAELLDLKSAGAKFDLKFVEIKADPAHKKFAEAVLDHQAVRDFYKGAAITGLVAGATYLFILGGGSSLLLTLA